jgi:hypothetical protein
MNRLPILTNWEQSSHSLHEAAQLLGAIRMRVRPPAQNFLEWALRVEPEGLSTDTLPSGGSVLLDFARATLVYRPPSGDAVVLPLAGQSQVSLFEALLGAMARAGERLVEPAAGQSYVQALLAALRASGHPYAPKEGELTSDRPLAVDPATSAAYGEALYRVFSAIARFRAGLEGVLTPIVVWPEHFDLSTLFFPPANAARADDGPQMNFGFAPFDATTEEPYLYAYAYPMPEGFETLALPAPASWHTASWKGMKLRYGDLLRAENPEALIDRACQAVFELLAPTLR